MIGPDLVDLAREHEWCFADVYTTKFKMREFNLKNVVIFQYVEIKHEETKSQGKNIPAHKHASDAYLSPDGTRDVMTSLRRACCIFSSRSQLILVQVGEKNAYNRCDIVDHAEQRLDENEYWLHPPWQGLHL